MRTVSILSLCLMLNVASSQNFWQQTGKIEGGRVNCLAVNSSGSLFAGNGAGLFRSTDNGANWVQLKTGLPYTEVRTVAINSSGHVFVGTGGNGAYRSTDNGVSWVQVNTGITSTSNSVTAITVGAGGTLFAGAFPGSVFRSTDNGGSWTQLGSGIGNTYISSLVVNSSGHIFAATHDQWGAASGGVFRSTDNGATWSAVNTGLTNSNVWSLVINSSGAVLAGTDNGVYRSNDNGATWTGTGLTGSVVCSFALGSGGSLYAGNGTGGVFLSTDNGVSWGAVGPASTTVQVLCLTLNSSGHIFAGTENGLYRSTDAGKTWAQTNAGLLGVYVQAIAVSKGGTIFAGTDGGGVFCSTDRGVSWSQINIGLSQMHIYSFVINAQGTVFAATNFGVFRSTDNGASWIDASLGLSSSVWALALNANGYLFAGTGSRGVFFSADNGDSWGEVNTGFIGGGVSSLTIDANQTLFAASAWSTTNQVFRSTNNGESWVAASSGLPNNSVACLAASPTGAVFATTGGAGICRSTDNGVSWVAVNNGMIYTYLGPIAVNARGYAFVGNGSGVFRSRDNGGNWTAVNTGLTYSNTYSLAFDDSGYVYAGTVGGGVYRSTQSTIELPPPHVFPANGALDQPTSVSLQWASPAGAQSYHVQVSGDSLFRGTLLVDDSTLTGTSKALTGLIQSIRYYWHVRVKTTYGAYSPFSSAWSFLVLPTTLPTVSEPFWQTTNGPFGGPVTSFAVNTSGHIFAANSAGVYRSTDNGATWKLINKDWVLSGARVVAIQPSGAVFVGTGLSGVFYSFDDGDTWTRVDVGNRDMSALAINAKGHVFAATGDGRAFRSTDNGQSWTQLNVQLTNAFFHAIAVNATGTLFAGIVNGGTIYRSTDNGANWTQLNTGIVNNHVNSFAIDSTGALFAATDGAGIYKSTDNGGSWAASNAGLTDTWVASVSISTGGSLFAATAGHGMFRSIDGGRNWVAVNTGLIDPSMSSTAVNLSGYVFASAFNGVYRSTDNGGSWSLVNGGLTNHDIRAIAVSPAGSIFAGHAGEGQVGGVFRSTDNGGSWIQVGRPLSGTPVVAIAVNANNSIFAGTLDGVFRSTNNGAGWTQVNTGLTNFRLTNCFAFGSGGLTFAGTSGGGVFRSTDNGTTWTQQISGLTATNVSNLAINSSGQLFAGTSDGGVFRSSDNGAGWTQMNTGLSSMTVTSLVINSSGHLFAGNAGANAGLFRSTNNGDSWTQLKTGMVNAVALNSSGYVFVAMGDGVYRSTDNGQSWTPVSSMSVQALAFNAGGYLFAGTHGSGILQSSRPTTGALVGDPYEQNNTADKASPINYNFSSSGAEINPSGDVDYYKFTGTAGDFAVIEALTDPASNLDIAVSLWDSAGTFLAGSDIVSTGTERILYGINKTQSLYIRVTEASDTRAYPSSVKDRPSLMTRKTAAVTGAYTLTLSRGVPLPPNALTVGNGFDGLVPLRWNAPASNPPVAYKVYRSASSSGPFASVGSTGGEDFVDRTATNGVAYFYQVRSIYAASNAESGPSNVETATPRSGGYKVSSRYAFVKPVLDGKIQSSEWSDATTYAITTKKASTAAVSLSIKNDDRTLYIAVEDSNASASTFNQLTIAFDADLNKTWDRNAPSREGYIIIEDSSGVPTVRFFGVTGDYPVVSIADDIRNPSGVTAKFSYQPRSVQYEISLDLTQIGTAAVQSGAMGLYVAVLSDDLNGESPPQALTLAPVTFSEITLAKTVSPSLVSPSTGATNQPTSIALSWNAVVGAVSYHLQVDKTNAFAAPVLDDSTLTATSRLVTSLANNTTYYWRVSARSASGSGPYSTPWSFTTIVAAPAAPTPASPIDGSINQPLTLTLGWNAPANAVTYRLQFDKTNTFATPVVDDSTLTVPSRLVTSLTNSTTYYWRVSARNVGGVGPYSSVFSFTTLPAVSAPPALSGPANGAASQPTTVTLTWNAAATATSYHLQVATSSAFGTPLVLEDSLLTATSRQLGGLAENSTYYWRARAKNIAGYSSWSTTFSFATAGTKTVTSPGITFPSNPTASTDYRLVSFPGTAGLAVGQILTGSQNTDWRIFRDNGGTMPNNLTELSSSSTLSPGEGYWLLTKGTLGFSRAITMPPLSSDGTYSISVRNGWNIISNPFDVPVSWTTVRQDNQMSSTLWTYGGTAGFQQSTSLEPFKGFYMYSSGTSLKIRYPFPSMRIQEQPAPVIDWKVQLSLESDVNVDAENFVGIAPVAREPGSDLNQPKPPMVFDQTFLTIVQQTDDGQRHYFSSDFRPSVGDGQVWYLEISNPSLSSGKVRAVGVESIPSEYEVMLIDCRDGTASDIRWTSTIPLRMASPKARFNLVVGKHSFVSTQVALLVPHEFEMYESYPNPFNPTTTITYQLAERRMVSLNVFDALGREVATLVNAEQAVGRYEVTFDGRGLSSGAYFVRLQAGNFVKTRKLMLLR